MTDKISYEYARVLKHRLKKKETPDMDKFKLLCESGFISKDDAKVIASGYKEMMDKHKKELAELIKSIKA
jgi:hypothetical protein